MTMARACQNCESRKSMMPFDNENFVVEHAGMTTTAAGLLGWRCAACGEVEFDAESARRYATASDELVLRDRERQSEEAPT
jgi:HTH-type transcriptional regulator/antitoxin MqsA